MVRKYPGRRFVKYLEWTQHLCAKHPTQEVGTMRTFQSLCPSLVMNRQKSEPVLVIPAFLHTVTLCALPKALVCFLTFYEGCHGAYFLLGLAFFHLTSVLEFSWYKTNSLFISMIFHFIIFMTNCIYFIFCWGVFVGFFVLFCFLSFELFGVSVNFGCFTLKTLLWKFFGYFL